MSNEKDDRSIQGQGSKSTRQPWEPMMLTYAGRIAEVVQGGGGKLSRQEGDPGERTRKPRGQE
jgi:hypothetical protein